MKTLKVNIGDTYNSLTIISLPFCHIKGQPWKVKVQCVCGEERIVRTTRVVKGVTKSCGCLGVERSRERNANNKYCQTHGQSATRLHRIWRLMKNRCHNPNASNWKWYGGKGVKVCRKWHTFENFYQWSMENGYEEHLTIDRINARLNYRPSNCRWVTEHFQKSRKKVKLV